MQPVCIRHTELPGTSRLFADFAYHFDRVSRFYRHDPHAWESYRTAAKEIEYPDDRRAALVAALSKQNPSNESLEKLARKGTVAVVTGQQVGLFSGPAYTVFKALTAIKLAERLSADGIPAVPVFWLATEDHDFAEVDHAWMYDAAGVPQAVRVSNAAPARQSPVGNVTVQHPPIEALSAILQGMPFADEVMDLVRKAYEPGVTMGQGCRRLLEALLGKHNLLFLDPLDPAIRAIGVPFMQKALSSADSLSAKLMERNKQLTDAGYHAQVHVDQKTSLFFLLNNGERQTLRRKGDEYKELVDRAADVSPNALLRPVWQDYLLPNVAYVGGPGELAYLAQSSVLYDELLGRMPVVLPRSSFTLLDGRSSKILQRNKMTVAQVFTPEEALRARIADTLVPAPVKNKIESATADVKRQLETLRATLETFDHSLAKALSKSQSKIVYQMEKIGQKTAREALRRDERAQEEAQYLGNRIYPHRHPQERFYSILPFLAQHGLEILDDIAKHVELECPDHQLHTCA